MSKCTRVTYKVPSTFLGEKAYLHDETSPSWIPTLELGYTKTTPSGAGRFERVKQRCEKKKLSDAASSLLLLQETVDVVDGILPVFDKKNKAIFKF